MLKNEDKQERRKVLLGKKNIALILILCILVIVAFVLKTREKKQDSYVSSGEPTEVTMLEIKTPYGDLMYPSTFEEFLLYEETVDGDVVSEKFYSMLADKKTEMFTIYFGKPEEGTLIGYILENEENIPVSVQISENMLNEAYEENQKNTYHQMVDGVNDVIASLSAFETFVAE